MTSDSGPAEALARARYEAEQFEPDHPWFVGWDDVRPTLRQGLVEDAEVDIEHLVAAGFRVVPERGGDTRALAERLRDFPSLAFRYEDTVHEETEHDDQRERYLADVRAAAAYLSGDGGER